MTCHLPAISADLIVLTCSYVSLWRLLVRVHAGVDFQAFLCAVSVVHRPVGSQGTDVWSEGEVRLERHHVLTTDGFELVWHRLSSSGTAGEQHGVRSRLRLVFLMHGLFENSVWVFCGLGS